MSLGLREYARHRKATGLAGGTLSAVQAARDSGRLRESLTKAGRIRSAKLADAEWAATTLEDRIPITGPTAVDAGGAGSSSLQEHRTRREAALADLAEIEVDEKLGDLVPAEEARAFMITAFTVVKTRLLGVPSGLRQRDRSLTASQIALVDDQIRDALEELAAGDAGDLAIAFLASVLIEEAGGDRDAFVGRIVARLREAAPRHGADAATLATAELLVREMTNPDSDDDDDDENNEPEEIP